MKPETGVSCHTIGHGNRPLKELIERLRQRAVERLVDVRAHPGSRRHPHFSRSALEASLPAHGIAYDWRGELLGGRRGRGDSPNVALRNESFRAYADHMQTTAFRVALDGLIQEGNQKRIAIMCAERLPWQCHRFLISDALVARGVEVLHIIDQAPPRPHRLNAIARITEEGALIYDGNTQTALDLD